MKRLAWLTTVVLATLTVVLLIWQFRQAVVLFLLSLAVAAALRPPINDLIRRGFRPSLALIVVYALGFGVAGLLFLFISPRLLVDLQHLANDFATGYQRVSSSWPQGSLFQQAFAERLPPISNLYEALFGQRGTDMLQTLFGFTLNFFEFVSYLGMVLVLSVYWTTDRVRFERLWLSLLPVERRAQAREIWRDIDTNIGAYLRSELIQSVLAGLLLGSGYWLIGLNYPVVLALAGTVAWLVPVLGALLALIPVIWVGLTGSLFMALGAAVYTLAIFIVLEWLVEPSFFNRQRFSKLLQVLIMIAFIDALGLPGLLIAPPVAIAVQILFGQLLQQRIPALAGRTIPELADLKQRVAKLRSMLTTTEIEPSPPIMSMIERLDNLLEEADQTTLPASSKESPQEINHVPVQIAQQPVQ